MNNRQKELLHILLIEHNDAIYAQELADRLSCSEKTIRNDLKKLEDFLMSFPSAKIIRKPGVGIYLEINQEERAEIFQQLLLKKEKSEEERTIEMSYLLLISDKAITLNELADKYYVPKSVIKEDLENITKWLRRFELEMESKQRIGNRIVGSEMNKRNALAHLSELIPNESNHGNYVMDLFLPSEITFVKRALQGLVQKFSLPLTDEAMESLLVHALIMMKRTKQKLTIHLPTTNKENVIEREEFEYGRWFIRQLELDFRITFPEDELIYFTWHLISSKRRSSTNSFSKEDENLAELVKKMTAKISQLTLVNLNEDEVLYNGLVVHVHAVINRLTFKLPITNPLLSDIKKMYPYMFSMVILALEEVNKDLPIDIPEDEAAYLVLHYQAALERLEKLRESKKRVLIVCHLGTGMSYLLQAKLEQQYKGIRVVGALGKIEVDAFLKEQKVDLIISTVPLDKVPNPMIVISPLFSDRDKAKLDQYFRGASKKTELSNDLSIMNYVQKPFIYLQMDIRHRFEVVEELGNDLVEYGVVKKEFVHSLLVRERSSATAIGGGVAIPHGNPDLVQKTTIAIAVMDEAIEWGSEFVSVVFLFAVALDDRQKMKSLIQSISRLSENPVQVEKLKKARTEKEIIAILSK